MARNPKQKQAYDGYVYILKIYTHLGIMYKIGTTNRTAKTRMLEIAGELYEVLGHIPKIELIRQKQTKDNYKIEAAVLNKTQKYRCCLGVCEWAGESELRKMDEQELLQTYDMCIAEGFAPTPKFEVSL
jgi:hypothetical protein